ncbi:TGF beta receptor associated protein 1 [Rasamsonia emersonii CBS 393.64]|uniref:TGF beta receptor associated protein 1 n=1 Tax=Rasamsonia emersonii (strain ATCC 16479 / CBS 393.64 / IMI 116815) TaxID=1408163 RepID=A0A0F4YK69_RASE3|nr:TGF beta receptor associated protein 1 [Rasamsonia emersonii CBS 393.64]KKA18261.1 TGF beta receptor associated protein 1 [Rasamsonia emersonii CBS 393.64]
MDDSAGPRKRRKLSSPKAAPYVLRQLLDNVPLDSEGGGSDVHITCVEYWNENLYIGTSAAEILHFVALPPDPSDDTNESTFILASRLPITHHSSTSNHHGVQQIVLLPTASKACILCNGVVTFYTLPELSPAFGNTKVGNCRWIGGLDLNRDVNEPSAEDPVIMIAVHNRIMLVRIGEEARRIRNIEFPGCLIASRRDTIACVADEHSYSLLDVEHQQKIPLFPISSSNEVFEPGHVEDIPSQSGSSLKRSSSASYGNPDATKLGAMDRSSSRTPDPFTATGSPRRSTSQERRDASKSKELPAPPPEAEANKQKPLPPAPKQTLTRLKPHIVSPTPSEFLLVTGTEETEPGVGMFVNMDGDVVRGTIEFQRYPDAVVIDGADEVDQTRPNSNQQEGYVLAIVNADDENGNPRKCLEIQRWDVDSGEAERQKHWVEIPASKDTRTNHVGIRHTTGPSQLNFYELGELLRMVRLRIPKMGPPTPLEDPTKASIERLRKEKELFESQDLIDRNREEATFAHGLGNIRSSLIVWSGNRIWRVLKNPLPLQLDDALQRAQTWEGARYKSVDREFIVSLTQSIKDTEPRTEAEFLGLEYIRQKAGLLLFADLLSMNPEDQTEAAILSTEEVLMESNLDPRLILLLIPFLRDEALQGPQGIWVHGGLAQVAEFYLEQFAESKRVPQVPDDAVLNMVKRYLFAWQRKRGYGSITDETFVFDSVDAGLLHLLLEQDAKGFRESRPSPTVRAELNRLADSWKGNFDRAVTLLEQYNRLFVLSRLYQSRKTAGKVLQTWRRIVEGEKDDDPEITVSGVEMQMRKYLVKIRDAQLVEEYGSWLAARNPNLGIQVFSDDSSRVKLEAQEVVRLLKKRAPNAVQDYLEHLVFSKNYSQYADDLIAYYLDTVLSVLQSSPAARESLQESYSTYRALRPPKPTYLNFIRENAPPEPWWQSRLRLLQLLGGGPCTQFTSSPVPGNLSYSVSTVLSRIEPFQNELVSESIILDGRQGRHREALRLLTHGLGDYDSAIRYCLFGGPSSTQTAAASLPSTIDTARDSERRELFKHLLTEFLQIEDFSERIERTSDLLARFAPWFDVHEVLALVPDDWSVEILSGFLVHVFRDLVSQAREARIQRALSASLNLRVEVEYLDSVEKKGGWIEDGEGLRGLKLAAAAAAAPAVSSSRSADGNNNNGNDSDFGEMVNARD